MPAIAGGVIRGSGNIGTTVPRFRRRSGDGGLKERRITHGLHSGAALRRLRDYGGLGHYAARGNEVAEHSHARASARIFAPLERLRVP